jgi:hypothetical protein
MFSLNYRSRCYSEWPVVVRAYYAWSRQRDFEEMHGLRKIGFWEIMRDEFPRLDRSRMIEVRVPDLTWVLGWLLERCS